MNTNSVIVDRKQCSDQSLVSAAMAGDVTAFTALCRLHSPRLLRTVRQITRNHEDAEDALQDAFMRAFVHLKSFDGRAQFATWLTRIALNSALMILRKRRHYPAVSIDSDREDEDRFASWEIADRADDPERRLLKSETTEWVRKAIAELDPTPRVAMEFWNCEELSAREGARKLNISKAAFKSRLSRAKAELRSELARSMRI
jgi:RNA polymerase sigma-70 factor (ECF subfamily)